MGDHHNTIIMALTRVQHEMNQLAKQVNILLNAIEHQTDESKAKELWNGIEKIKDEMRTLIYNNPLDAEQLAQSGK